MLDVLLYLFQNYLHPDALSQSNAQDHALGHKGMADSESLTIELTEAGFEPTEIDRAFDWLEGILNLQKTILAKKNLQTASIRFYAEPEIKKLSLKSRGFLLSLEQAGLLDQHARELVIDRAMALEVNEINLDGMKWVVFMVLLNQPHLPEATAEMVAWLESAILEPVEHAIH
jgi:Smg protein